MARQQLLTLIFLAVLTLVNPGFAGPSCARRYAGRDDCPVKCKRGWGYRGRAMGTDPWGQVMTTTVTELDAVITKACRVRLKSLASSSSAAVGPTAAIANVGNVPSSVITSVTSPRPTTSSTRVASSKSSSSSPAAVTNGFVRSSSSPSKSSPPPPPPSSTSKAPALAPTSSPEPVTTTQEQPKPTTTSTRAEPQTTTTKQADPPAQTTKAAATQDTSSSGATSQSDIDQYLSAHNTIRAQHGASALTWSDNLAAKAQQWANNCVFQHSGGTLGAFGENLAAGTGGSYNIASAVKSWTDEVTEYDPNNPQPSHFTQVVWKGSTQVGCALQSCSGIFDASFGAAKYFVCEYSPQGNIIGKFGENVQV